LYLFANLAIEIITKDYNLRAQQPEYDDLVAELFPDLFTTMLTLIQFDLGHLYTRMIPFKPTQLSLFFLAFLLVVCLSLLNLVTAVIVEKAIEEAQADKEAQNAYKVEAMKKAIPEIRRLFNELDADGNGTIDRREIQIADEKIKAKLGKVLETDDLLELFEILDEDGNGDLDIEEFVAGMMKLVTSSISPEQIRMGKNINLLRNDTRYVLHYVTNLEDDLREEIRKDMNELLRHHRLPELPIRDFLKEEPEKRASILIQDELVQRATQKVILQTAHPL
jgi:hypothetical protein